MKLGLFFSRYLDSTINEREYAAVNEWLTSKKLFIFLSQLIQKLQLKWGKSYLEDLGEKVVTRTDIDYLITYAQREERKLIQNF